MTSLDLLEEITLVEWFQLQPGGISRGYRLTVLKILILIHAHAAAAH